MGEPGPKKGDGGGYGCYKDSGFRVGGGEREDKSVKW